jgi:hypothetical protein
MRIEIIAPSTLPDQAHVARMRPITSCPNSLNHRLTQVECIPVSSAIRLRGILPNSSRRAFGVVLTFCSTATSPVASRTQYQLDRSPRSSVVGLQSFHLPCCCSADLLHRRSPLSRAFSSASITWEPTASRPSPVSSSHCVRQLSQTTRRAVALA